MAKAWCRRAQLSAWESFFPARGRLFEVLEFELVEDECDSPPLPPPGWLEALLFLRLRAIFFLWLLPSRFSFTGGGFGLIGIELLFRTVIGVLYLQFVTALSARFKR